MSSSGGATKKANAASSHPDLNEGPVDLQSTALTPELRELVDIGCALVSDMGCHSAEICKQLWYSHFTTIHDRHHAIGDASKTQLLGQRGPKPPAMSLR
jgi:hypothetical protein